MEACQRSLFDRLIDHPKWSWEQLAGDLHQLVSGSLKANEVAEFKGQMQIERKTNNI